MEYLQLSANGQEYYALKLAPKVNIFCGPYYLGLKRAFEKVKDDKDTVALTYDELYSLSPEGYLNDILTKVFWRERGELKRILESYWDLNQKILAKKLELEEIKQNLIKMPEISEEELDTDKLKLLKRHLKERERRELFYGRTKKEFERFDWYLEKFLMVLAEFGSEGFWSEEKVAVVIELIRALKEELIKLNSFPEEPVDEALQIWVKEQETLLESYLMRENLLKKRKITSSELKELIREKVKFKKLYANKRKEYLNLILKMLIENFPKEQNFFTYQILIDGDISEYRLYLENLYRNSSSIFKKKIQHLCEQISPKRLIRLLNHRQLEKQPEYENFADLIYWLKGRLTYQDKYYLKNMILGETIKLVTGELKDDLLAGEPELQNLATLILILAFEPKTVSVYYPERAMDSYKISRWLIPVLKARRGQTLLFTQNPGLITATKPENLVVFGFSDKKISFVQKTYSDPEMKKLLLTFLEGGKESFDRRQSYYQL